MSDNKALVKIRPQIRAEENEAAENLAGLKAAPCTAQDAAEWSSAAVEVRARWNHLDELEKTITRPMAQALEAARAVFRPAKTYWREAEGIIKERLGALRVATDARDVAALSAARDAAADGDADAAVTALATRPDALALPGVSTRGDWDFEVIAADMLPGAFLIPDLRAIRDEIRRQTKAYPSDTPVIPGVKFTRVAKVAIRAKR